MKTNKIILILLAIPLLLLEFQSCAKEDIKLSDEKIDSSLSTITITAYGADSNAGSKTIITGDDFKSVYWSVGDKINVFYNNQSNLFTSTNTSVSYISNFIGTIEGISDPSQLEGKEVVGLYPYDPEATMINRTTITTTLPGFQKAVDDTFAENLFISMGKSTSDATKMYFYNVCSGVCFTVNHNDIKTVTIRGVNDEPLAGKFRVKFTDVDGDQRPIVQAIASPVKIITVEAPDGGTFIPGKRYYAVTLPQSLPDGIIIEGFKEDGTVYQNTISKNVTLKRAVFARKTEFDSGIVAEDLYDYTLSVVSPKAFTYLGGTHAFDLPTNTYGLQVRSFRTLKSNPAKIYPVAWKMQMSNDGGTTWGDLTQENKSTYGVEWMSMQSFSDTPSDNLYTIYPVTAEPAERGVVDLEEYHTTALQSAWFLGRMYNNTTINSAITLDIWNIFNPSNPSISQTTANCYIVNAPGWYSIPMVYGNAIKNGAINTNSFISNASQVLNDSNVEVILMNFIDHTGAAITQPWITNANSRSGNYSVTKAELVWQDSPGLVSNVRIGDGNSHNDRIYFYIDRETIHQGNAVIAAYVGDVIAWSWHIWVTDQDFSNPIAVTNHQNVVYDFTPVNLGWCDIGEDPDGYLPRVATTRIIQTIGMLTEKCFITQNGYSDYHYEGYNTLYQWGRKDPMLPSVLTTNGNKIWYDANGIEYDEIITEPIENFDVSQSIDRIKQNIQNPFTIFTWNGVDYRYINLWSANENTIDPNDNVVVKTIYDPSPMGYCLPASNAFTGFTTTAGLRTNNLSEFNISGDYFHGFDFYTNSSRTATIFFKMLPWRRPSTGGFYDIDESSGNYWTAHSSNMNPTFIGHAYYFEIDYDNPGDGGHACDPHCPGNKAHGFSIRPVKEK